MCMRAVSLTGNAKQNDVHLISKVSALCVCVCVCVCVCDVCCVCDVAMWRCVHACVKCAVGLGSLSRSILFCHFGDENVVDIVLLCWKYG